MKINILSGIIGLIFSSIILANAQSSWDYEGKAGPSHWGENNKGKIIICETNKQRVHIKLADISLKRIHKLSSLHFNYTPFSVPLSTSLKDKTVFEFSTTRFIIDYPTSDYPPMLQINIKNPEKEINTVNWRHINYNLKQFHFHVLNDRVTGKRYPLELHLVYENTKLNKILFIAVFIDKAQKDNPSLAEIIANVPASINKDNPLDNKNISMNDLLPSDYTHYYVYLASLNNPNCNISLAYLLLKNPIYASDKQITMLRKILQAEPSQ